MKKMLALQQFTDNAFLNFFSNGAGPIHKAACQSAVTQIMETNNSSIFIFNAAEIPPLLEC